MGRGSSTVQLQVAREHYHHSSIIVSVVGLIANQMSRSIEHGCAVVELGRLENRVLDHQKQVHSLKFYRMKQRLESLAAATEYYP